MQQYRGRSRDNFLDIVPVRALTPEVVRKRFIRVVPLFEEHAGFAELVASDDAAIPVVDTGVGVDVSDLVVQLTLSETGAGVDTVLLAAALPVVDVNTAFTELSAIGIPAVDSGAGSDAVVETAAYALAETPVGTDVVVETAVYGSTDTGTGADTGGASVPIPVVDTGAGTDSVSETASLPRTDTGAGVDAILTLVASVTGTDVGTGVDSSQIAAALATLDAATGVDTSILVVVLVTTDSGSGVDSSSKTTSGGDESKTASDSGSGSEAIDLAAAMARTETATGVDVAILIVPVDRVDTGAGVDAFKTLTAQLISADIGTLVEPAQIQALLVINDAGTLIAESVSIQTGALMGAITAIIVRKEEPSAIDRTDTQPTLIRKTLQGTTLSQERVRANIVRVNVETE